jgi:hypothetical protein
VDGVLQQNDEHYTISVLGVGVGPASEKHRSTVGIKIGASPKPLTDVTIDRVEANTAVLTIPAVDLNPLSDPNKPIAVSASLEFDIQDKGLTGWKPPRHFSLPFRLMLTPINAGTISVAVRTHKYDWIDTGETRSKTAYHDRVGQS